MILHVEHLTKVYSRHVRANDDISLVAQAGEVLGLLGHNGAGKTTLLSQIAGRVRPTSGTVRLMGRDAIADPAFARRTCSVQLQAQAPLNGVTPRQAIEILGRIRGGTRRHVRERATRLLKALDITEWANVPGEKLSGGIRRLTAFCMAAVEPGRLVMLDEPTNDVDPVRRRLMWQQVRDLASGAAAVVVVTHNVAEAERIVDRIVVLDEGRVVASGTPVQLRGHLSGDLRLELSLTPGAPSPPIPGWAGSVSLTSLRLHIQLATADVQEAVAWAQALRVNGAVQEFAINPVSLEDVYITLTRTGEGAMHDATLAS